MSAAMIDDSVKSPDAALRFTLRHCSVRQSTPHSSGFARLACGLFTKPSPIQGFCDFLRERHPFRRSRVGVKFQSYGLVRAFGEKPYGGERPFCEYDSV